MYFTKFLNAKRVGSNPLGNATHSLEAGESSLPSELLVVDTIFLKKHLLQLLMPG